MCVCVLFCIYSDTGAVFSESVVDREVIRREYCFGAVSDAGLESLGARAKREV